MKQIDTLHAIQDIVLHITDSEVHGVVNGAIPEFRNAANMLSKKQLQNISKCFDSNLKKKDIAAFCDTTMFFTGKTGIVFTTEGFYFDGINHMRQDDPVKMPVLYSQLQSVLEGDIPGTFVLLYRDGSFERCFGGIYNSFIIVAVNKILQEVFDVVPQEKAKTETIPVQRSIESTTEHHPKIMEHTNIPEVGQVSMFNSTPFVVLQKKKTSTWKRVFYELTIRELNSSVISRISIGQDTFSASHSYISEFISPVSHTGFEKVEKDNEIFYRRIIEKYLYPVLSCKISLGMYEGSTVVKDLLSGSCYQLEETQGTLQELKHVHKGDILEVCEYLEKRYLVCSFNMEKVSAVLYTGDGKYRVCDSKEDLQLDCPSYIYKEKAFVKTVPEKGRYYRLLMTKGANLLANTQYPFISSTYVFLKEIPCTEKYVYIKKTSLQQIQCTDVLTQESVTFDESWMDTYVKPMDFTYAFCKVVVYTAAEKKVVDYHFYIQIEKNMHFRYAGMQKGHGIFRNQSESTTFKIPSEFLKKYLAESSSHTIYSCYDSSLKDIFEDGSIYFVD